MNRPGMLVGAVLAIGVVAVTAGTAARSGPTRDPWTVQLGMVAQAETQAAPEPVVPAATTAPVGPPTLVADVAPRPAHPAPAWVAQVSARTGIGAVAVRAYGAATLTVQRDQPGCRLGWPTIAAIGAVESAHGTHGGAVLLDDGHPSIPVIGPALDGTAGTAAVRAGADDARWHGDTTWAHAVGPMQFLPSTWRRWASDGDGDGALDPNDLDDAALAAGRYLCASGADLTTGPGWHAAVLSYNHDDAYVDLVLATADRYAGLSS